MGEYFKKGAVVLFQGDSITDAARTCENCDPMGYGYPAKVKTIYEALYANNDVKFVNRGISGNKVIDLLNRYDQDFKDVNPDFISILIGINDLWRWYDSNEEFSIEVFERNYTMLLKRIKQDMPNAKIMIIEQFVTHPNGDKLCWHKDGLDEMIQVTRRLAQEFADYYIPTSGIFAKNIIEKYSDCDIAEDGVHPTQLGHGIIAKEYLKALNIL